MCENYLPFKGGAAKRQRGINPETESDERDSALQYTPYVFPPGGKNLVVLLKSIRTSAPPSDAYILPG